MLKTAAILILNKVDIHFVKIHLVLRKSIAKKRLLQFVLLQQLLRQYIFPGYHFFCFFVFFYQKCHFFRVFMALKLLKDKALLGNSWRDAKVLKQRDPYALQHSERPCYIKRAKK